MENILRGNYSNLFLPQFVEALNRDCYSSLEKLCESAGNQIDRLEHFDANQPTSQYTALCTQVIREIVYFVNTRKEQYVPYILTLHEKAAGGHDCAACSGGCKLQHDMQLIEIKGTLAGLRNVQHRLQMATLPLYSDTVYPDAYRILRNQMALIENGLTELFSLEEQYLIPKITEAQKSINAGS